MPSQGDMLTTIPPGLPRSVENVLIGPIKGACKTYWDFQLFHDSSASGTRVNVGKNVCRATRASPSCGAKVWGLPEPQSKTSVTTADKLHVMRNIGAAHFMLSYHLVKPVE